jgi:hypothetical protein
MRPALALLVTLALTGLAGRATAAPELASATTPYPGVVHEIHVDDAIPARIHVVALDISSQELNLFATETAQRGQTPSELAAAVGAHVVINGDSFAAAGFIPSGLAVGNAVPWPDTADDATNGFFRFDRNGDLNHADLSPPAAVVAAAELPAGTMGVVGGRPMLVVAGVIATSFDCADLVAMPCLRAPRSAVAVADGGATLWLAVVDGWQAASAGMTAAELAAFLAGLGAHDALLLDGGAAAALVIAAEGGVVSAPSDGSERAVANHIAVKHGPLPPGQLVGFIRERDIFDATANLTGALVELDDGRSDLTGADGLYSFPDTTPRYACVTAAKPGYHAETRCKQVLAGEVNYNSIALYPDSDFVDAGPGAIDAAVDSDGAAPAADATALADAIVPGADAGSGGEPGCACAVRAGASRGPDERGVLFAMALALVDRRARRREANRR